MDARFLCTVILARDYRKLVAWYRKTLQMKVRRVVTERYDWTELERPGLRIGITKAKQMGVKLPRKRANAVVLHLVTKDVKGLLRRAKEVTPRPITPSRVAARFPGPPLPRTPGASV
ncbi:MAG: hypothetical protein FD180_5166 [Planctomycetota bacterium]|nr:MAG: hypothetical protein FD180_5166 [Planctomycetota bacterium]